MNSMQKRAGGTRGEYEKRETQARKSKREEERGRERGRETQKEVT
jgi:hypothetical protein